MRDSRAKSQADRLELLAQAAEQMEEVRLGHKALMQRVDEMRGGYPSGGDGASTAATGDGTSENFGKPDEAAKVLNHYEDQLKRVWKEVGKLVAIHREHVEPRHAVSLLTDPGCELCHQISSPPKPVYSNTYTTVCAAHRLARCEQCDTRKKPRQRICYWCHQFTKKTGRVPSLQERRDHHDGKRIRVSV